MASANPVYSCPDVFTTNSPFFIDDDTHVVAIVNGDLPSASPLNYHWLHSDFYAFQYLFRGLGCTQSWITAIPPREMVDLFGPLYHGDPHKLRREVLSKDRIERGQLSDVMLCPPSQLKSTFLDEISMASDSTPEHLINLLLLVLCPAIIADSDDNRHGSLMPISQFYLGLHGGRLSMGDITNEIPPGVKTTLVTPSYFSEGWLVERNLHLRRAATPLAPCSIETMALACGPAFVAPVVETMAGLRRNENGASSGWGPFRQQDYNELCNAAYRICGRSNIVCDEIFEFEPRNTEWERAWDDETRALFARLDARWKRLKPIRSACLFLDPDNTAISFEDANARANPRLQYVINQFLVTCPPNNRDYFGRSSTSRFLQSCSGPGRAMELQNLNAPVLDYLRRNAWETVHFRVCYALAVDDIVARLQLPMPSGKRALVFDIQQWFVSHTKGISIAESSYFGPYIMVYHRIGQLLRPMDLRPRAAQGGAYTAMNGYLTASLFEFFRTTCSVPRLDDKIQEIKDLVDTMANHVSSYAVADESLVYFAENVRNENFDLEMEQRFGYGDILDLLDI